MKASDIFHLWAPARQRLMDLVGDADSDNKKGKASKALAALLGEPYPQIGWHDHMELTDEHRKTLKLIGGPNGDFILKVMLARKVADEVVG